MKAETRQTLIGVTGQTVILLVALMEGFNGLVTAAGVLSIGVTVTPEILENLPGWFKQ